MAISTKVTMGSHKTILGSLAKERERGFSCMADDIEELWATPAHNTTHTYLQRGGKREQDLGL